MHRFCMSDDYLTAQVDECKAGDKKYEDHRLEREEWKDIKPWNKLMSPVNKNKDKNGRGELCRLLFVLADKKYEDHRFEREEWKDIKPCNTTILFQQDNIGLNIFIPHSKSFLHNKGNQISWYDITSSNFVDTSRAENQSGDEVTLADVAVFDVIARISDMWSQDLMNMSTVLKAHCEKIASIPSIKAWLENRPKTAR
ncbi:HPGDS [Mytilus edulis]|uniref:HPGDS n=1 Tax=Mytilus edulis TaxID=6550 RepID=A0A8S3RTS7_MYTED|nr:HPGDS [Mytilus edulis]